MRVIEGDENGGKRIAREKETIAKMIALYEKTVRRR